MRHFLFLLLFMTAVAATAQRVTLSGTVTDGANGQPIAGVLVTVRPSGAQKVLAFTQTMANGRFEVTLTADATDRVLYFSMMGYAARTLPIEKGRATYDVTLKEQATALREVIIRAPSIHERGTPSRISSPDLRQRPTARWVTSSKRCQALKSRRAGPSPTTESLSTSSTSRVRTCWRADMA